MSLQPLTADAFRIATPEDVFAQWLTLGTRLQHCLDEALTLDGEHSAKVAALRDAELLYADLSVSAACAPLQTWQLMARTLHALVENSAGDYLLGAASALSLQLDVEAISLSF